MDKKVPKMIYDISSQKLSLQQDKTRAELAEQNQEVTKEFHPRSLETETRARLLTISVVESTC